MLKLKPLWLKMIYTGGAGLITLFILSFNFKKNENLLFKTDLKSLHKMEEIKNEIENYAKNDIYADKDLIISSKINAFLVNDLISKIESEKCKNDLKNTRISFVVEKCYDNLNYGNYNNLDKKVISILNSADLEGTNFASDAVIINRNYNAIDYYLNTLPRQIYVYMVDCYADNNAYFDDKTNDFRRTINNIPNLESRYKNNVEIQKLKKSMIDAIDQLEFDMINYNPN